SETGFRQREISGEGGIVMLDLTRGPVQLFKKVSERRRTFIRRAIRAGVSVSPLDKRSEFDECYSLYTDWCAFKGLPAEPAYVQEAAFALTNNRLVLAARYSGKLIAVSTFRFQRGGLIEYAANWSRREETKVRPNDLLLWRSIEWAISEGFTAFSLGG